MSTTDLPKANIAPQAGGMGAGAAIFNRIERRPRRSKWLIAAPIGVVAVFAIGALVAYESMNRPVPGAAPAAPPLAIPAQATTAIPGTPPMAPAPVVQATPARAAIAAPARVRPAVRHRDVVQRERRRAPRAGRVVANAPADLPAVTLPHMSAPEVSTAAPPPAAPTVTPVPTVTAPPPQS